MNAANYPFLYHVEATFHDMDAMGHVNHATYFIYMETARIKYLLNLNGEIDRSSLDIIAVKAECTYKSPAFMGEQLTVGVGISRFGNTSFDMIYRIDTADGRLVALGKTIHTMYDYQANSTFPVPNEFKASVQALQGDWRSPAEQR